MEIHLEDFQQKLREYAKLNEQIIFLEGVAEVIAANLNGQQTHDDDYRKDYLMFCLTKFTKTLNSILVLLEKNLNEDALILTRSNYEVVIHAKALVNDREMIKHFIEYKLGLEKERNYRFAKDKNGRILSNKIIDKRFPDRTIRYISSIKEIAIKAGEKSSYRHIYRFLCEQTHCNLLTSGYYREGVYYSVDNGTEGAKLNVILFNVGLCLKLYNACLDSDLLGEDFEEIEDILCSILMNDKLMLQEWFEIEEQRVRNLIDEASLVELKSINEYIKVVENSKWALIKD
ncbi:DUF5677 domain-containing protein [Lysinibacillus sp. 54212]|uniref:DUF5677 domain-containing protein n=1 Tax=Lysinibacillus sp. 54212 TaxID=3119829 RepID=UPI002FC5C292